MIDTSRPEWVPPAGFRDNLAAGRVRLTQPLTGRTEEDQDRAELAGAPRGTDTTRLARARVKLAERALAAAYNNPTVVGLLPQDQRFDVAQRVLLALTNEPGRVDMTVSVRSARAFSVSVPLREAVSRVVMATGAPVDAVEAAVRAAAGVLAGEG